MEEPYTYETLSFVVEPRLLIPDRLLWHVVPTTFDAVLA